MTVTDPYTGIGVITRGVFDSDMAAISLSLHSSCNDIALNEKNSPSFCQIHFYRGIFHLLSSCTLSTLRAFNSSSFHPSSPQIHPFSMIPVTPQVRENQQGIDLGRTPQGVRGLKQISTPGKIRHLVSHSARSAWIETTKPKSARRREASHSARSAWIETFPYGRKRKRATVALRKECVD